MSVKAHIRDDIARDDIEFAVVVRDAGVNAGLLIGMQHVRDGEPVPVFTSMPDLRARDLIQAILDAAWEYGMRPSGYGDLRESTTAVRAHLSDMRLIAFHKLGMKEPAS